MAVTKWDPLSIDGQNLTVSATLFDSTLSNFVAYFPISTLDASLIANARGDYQDIRFYTQAGTELDREITTGGSCFVRLPSASSSVSTVLDVNSGSGVSKGNDTGTWTTPGYDGVWHLEASSGTQPSSTGIGDASPRATDGGGATGKILNGYDHDGSNAGGLTCADPSSFSFNVSDPITVGGWVYVDNNPNNGFWLTKTDGTRGYELLCTTVAGGGVVGQRVYWIMRGISYYGKYSSTTINNGQWYHIVGTIDNTVTNGKIYINGVQESTSIWASGTPTNIANSTNFCIGDRIASPQPVDGRSDEIRVGNIEQSADYIKAWYNNENDYASYITVSNYTVFGGGRIITNLNPPSLGNNTFYSLVG